MMRGKYIRTKEINEKNSFTMKCKGLVKDKNSNWKGDNASYSAFHMYLRKNYGNPLICESCMKIGAKGLAGRWNIDWALKIGFEHDHKRENYLQLCRSCHMKYDMTDEKRNFMSKVSSHYIKIRKRNSLGRLLKMAI